RDTAANRDGAAPVERASQPRSDRHQAGVIAARPVVVVPLPSLTALPLHANPATRRRRSIGRTFIFFNRKAADVDGTGRGNGLEWRRATRPPAPTTSLFLFWVPTVHWPFAAVRR
ncbi:hypothetical protein NTC87_17650, partial [Stenotrophomonas geniculata]|nr:hypothetical protein [Stenotrophomonas geniculata]